MQILSTRRINYRADDSDKEDLAYLSFKQRMRNNFKTDSFFLRKLIFASLIILLIGLVNLSFSEKDLNTLPSNYKKWLEEEVLYIITPKEKNVFLQLKTDKERNLFIEAFWRQRDPNSLTEKTEFKKEHYRRIIYAKQNFARGTPLPGWKTDRGRMYIILGPPVSVEKYESSSQIQPTIIWFYQGLLKYGLPDAFYLVFFKDRGVGDYRLYSPAQDGPQKLLVFSHGYSGQIADEESIEQLARAKPQLARLSLSLIPGERVEPGSVSLASDQLFSNIYKAPQRNVKNIYAEKFLMYKDLVEVEYSTNYVENESLITVIRDKKDTSFVHYLFEIKKFSVDQYQDKYFTKLNINGNITDLEGNIIYQYERSIPFEFNRDQFEELKSKMFCFQDMFPLIEGNYKFNLLVKNEASKEFTSIEKDILIFESSSLQMSPLILAHKMEDDSSPTTNRPFKVGDFRLLPSPRNDFVLQDTLFLFFQIFGLNEALKQNGSLEIVIHKGDEIFKSKRNELKKYDSFDFFLEEFSLQDFPSAYYKIEASLLDKENKKILHEQENFYIVPVVSIPRAWIFSVILPSSDNALFPYTLGQQFFNKKDYTQAKTLLEKAYHQNPTYLQFALGYGRILFLLEEFKTVKEILVPFLEGKNGEVLQLLARSSHILGEIEEAVTYYNDYLSHYGINYSILTLLGDCYYQLGNTVEALQAWEKSLEINPNQEEIKKIIKKIKKGENKKRLSFN